MIQNIYACSKFTPNENLNKTCENTKRCIIYYDEYCNNFTEKTDKKSRKKSHKKESQ